LINASSISFGSEVSIFFDASTEEDAVALSKDSAILYTPIAPDEYNILYLTDEEVGQAYMNTDFGCE
jgi:phosphatidate phosphatase PAH1